MFILKSCTTFQNNVSVLVNEELLNQNNGKLRECVTRQFSTLVFARF